MAEERRSTQIHERPPVACAWRLACTSSAQAASIPRERGPLQDIDSRFYCVFSAQSPNPFATGNGARVCQTRFRDAAWTVLSPAGHRQGGKSLDVAAEPPRIVLEGRESCSNADRVQARLDDILSMARAPGPGWSVTMRVERDPSSHSLRAAADVANDSGIRIAHRGLAGNAADCDAFAQAVGVWASLVLDRERRRAAKSPTDDVASHTASLPTAASQRTEAAGADVASVGLPAAADGALDDEIDPSLRGDSKRPTQDVVDTSPAGRPPKTLEVGISTFLMTSIGPNSIMGGSPYVVIETNPGFFLRPSIAIGQELAVHGDYANESLFAARLDACARIPGNYMPNRGLEVDLCSGTDVAVAYFPASQAPGSPARTLFMPLVDVGPSLDLGGEIGGGWWVILRAVGGLNVIHERVIENGATVVDPGWLSARLELAAAWRLR
jgi:hypothetical protein